MDYGKLWQLLFARGMSKLHCQQDLPMIGWIRQNPNKEKK